MKKKLSLIFLILSIASLAGTIITTVMYFINKGKVNSVEFIRIASNSIKEAKELMDKTSMLGWSAIILGIITVVFMVVTTIFFIMWGREKKMRIANREVTLNEKQPEQGL